MSDIDSCMQNISCVGGAFFLPKWIVAVLFFSCMYVCTVSIHAPVSVKKEINFVSCNGLPFFPSFFLPFFLSFFQRPDPFT